MAAKFPLEDFGLPSRKQQVDASSAALVERARNDGYEAGYQSGWDDAVAAEQDRDKQISEEFARNLQDLGFTYHEARAHVVSSVSELLDDLIGTIFPDLLGDAVGLHFLRSVKEATSELADGPIQIVVNPSDADVLSGMTDAVTSLPVKVVVEEALVPGQAYFKLGSHEKRIDLDKSLQDLRHALDGVKNANREVLLHGTG